MAKKNKMNRKDAIDYLEDHEEIEGIKKYSKAEEKKIREVMKEGKCYGDPVVNFVG